jgi:hypothetical protein
MTTGTLTFLPHAVEADEADDPFDVGPFRVDGIVVQSEITLHLHEELWLGLRLILLRIRHSILPVNVNGGPDVLIMATRQSCQKTP